MVYIFFNLKKRGSYLPKDVFDAVNLCHNSTSGCRGPPASFPIFGGMEGHSTLQWWPASLWRPPVSNSKHHVTSLIHIYVYIHIYIYRLHEGRAQLTSINHQIGAFQFARRSRISDHTMRLSHDPRPGGHRDKQADFLRAQLPTSLVGGRTLYKSNAQTSWNNPLLSNCIILLYDLYVRPTKTSSWFWSNICYCCCLSICWWGTFSNGFGLYKSSKNSRYLFPQHLSRLPRPSSQAVFSNSILCWSPFS